MILEPASFITDLWNDQLVAHDRQWLFLVLAGFVGSFAFIRMSTRLMRSPKVPWWPGSVVSEGGVHVHHLVFGIVTMMVAGTISFAGFATTPIYEICAVFFGIGIGLTIDEFALWVHLDDVYWAEEGRRSIDATVIAAAALGLIVLGVRPFQFEATSALDVVLIVLILLLQLLSLRSVSPDTACSAIRLDPATGVVRRATSRQARLALGAALLRRAQPAKAGASRAALSPGSPHRPLQGAGADRDRGLDREGLPGEDRRARVALGIAHVVGRLGRATVSNARAVMMRIRDRSAPRLRRPLDREASPYIRP